ncbi:hypothetical protein EK21DRAFT_105353 [Setomelanomma holmii]|uniref:Uncharacterized protein n=1 Tax=Setomelanomma holmii TaxID=210430 RepID=A0A9P4GXN6_9PLEO|nr:hypothetical protein EK21DRAFT_105353 [Setomelanomma holmii]
MRAITLLALLALRAALPILAVGNLTYQNCTEVGCEQTPHLRISNEVGTAGTDPPKPNPRPPPPLPVLSRPEPATQPASDALWDTSGVKGCTLGWAMQTTDQEAGALYVPIRASAQSPYSDVKDLLLWHWYRFADERLSESFHDLYGTWGVGWALEDLGISSYTDEYEGGKNVMINIAHEDFRTNVLLDQQSYGVNGMQYRATGASYTFTVNPEQGLIIGLNRESPKYAAKDRRPEVSDDLLPKLNQFSDVAWITWKAYTTGGPINNLKYFMSVRITNPETRQILKRALDANSWELSSPNIQGFAYFLIQHKAELGNMFINKIQVFKGETEKGEPCILVHLRQPLDQPGSIEEEHVVKRSGDANLLRVHTFRARL